MAPVMGRDQKQGFMVSNEDQIEREQKMKNQLEDQGSGGNQVLDGSKRPQTSHGRVRRPGQQNQMMRKREEKTAGLGETTKEIWSIDDEKDLSKKQILREMMEAH